MREVSAAVLSNTRMLGANSRLLHAVGDELAVSSLHNAVGVAFAGTARRPGCHSQVRRPALRIGA